MSENISSAQTTMLHVSIGPHIRQREAVPSIMINVLIALAPALIAAVVFFGMPALLLIALCIATTVSTEALICLLLKKQSSISDFSAVVTGALLACTLPPHAPWWIAILGGIFAIGVVKMAFGGLGQTLVNPALASWAMLSVSFPAIMNSFVAPIKGSLSGLEHGIEGIPDAIPLAFFKANITSGNFQPLELQDALVNLFIGNVGGYLGATSGLALLLGAFYLFYKGIIRFRISLSFIAIAFLLFWIFNGTGSLFTTEAFIVPLFQILSGGLLLAAFFMATDPATTSVTPWGKIVFGCGCGILLFLIRAFGGYPEGAGYAVLLMNLAAPLIDRITRPRPFGDIKKHE